MSQLVLRHNDEKREIIYDADEETAPLDTLYRVVHLTPLEIDRIKSAKSEEVQNLLRRYI